MLPRQHQVLIPIKYSDLSNILQLQTPIHTPVYVYLFIALPNFSHHATKSHIHIYIHIEKEYLTIMEKYKVRSELKVVVKMSVRWAGYPDLDIVSVWWIVVFWGGGFLCGFCVWMWMWRLCGCGSLWGGERR